MDTALSAGSDPAVRALLECGDPSIEYLTRTDVLGQSRSTASVRRARAAIIDAPNVASLLAGQRGDGGFGVHPYRKWGGSFWRLISLVELAIPAREPRALAAFEDVLRWVGGPRLGRINVVDGRVRRCASQEGAALAVGCRLGLAGDERVQALARSLIEWQWPAGGWNCDVRPRVTHPSFHESLAPLWGLTEYRAATGDDAAGAAAERAADFFLEHRMYRSCATGEARYPAFQRLRWPPYWHYDVLRGLDVLRRAGHVRDPRARDALELLDLKRDAEGMWRVEGRWWKGVGSVAPNAEVVDWRAAGENEILTLSALRVLAAAGRV